MTVRSTGLAALFIVMEDAAVVGHERGCATLPFVIREMTLLANCGALVTAALGFVGLLFPSAVSRVLGIQPDGPLGIAEFRATYGGFFLCLGIGCFVAQSPSAFTVVGAAWCAAAAARVVCFVVDGSRSWRNVVGILFEASVGGAMLAARL
jgi:hypothetical protein